MRGRTDIAVIGGGPCGSFSALTAARLGADVVVFEEHTEIGAPQHCAGLLSLSGLKRIPLQLPPEVVENEVKGAVFYAPSGEEFVIRRDVPVSYAIDRELFDKYLAELAKAAGAKYFLGSRVTSVLSDSGVASGVAIQGTRTRNRVAAHIVIDAEGCSSVLLKRVGLTPLDAHMAVNAIQADVDKVEDVDLETVEVYLGRRYAPGFFAWIIPRRNSSAKIGLATRRGDPRDYLHRFMKHHPIASKKLKQTTVRGISLHSIPLGGMIPKAYSNGFLAVGDAASQVKPTTGGGVVFGLLCSKTAGAVAAEALKTDDFSETALSRYQHRCRDLIGFELAVMRQMRRLINRLSDNRIDNAIALANRLGSNRSLEAVGDMDFQGRSLVHAIRHPTVLATMIYLILSSLFP